MTQSHFQLLLGYHHPMSDPPEMAPLHSPQELVGSTSSQSHNPGNWVVLDSLLLLIPTSPIQLDAEFCKIQPIKQLSKSKSSFSSPLPKSGGHHFSLGLPGSLLTSSLCQISALHICTPPTACKGLTKANLFPPFLLIILQWLPHLPSLWFQSEVPKLSWFAVPLMSQ